MTMVTLGVVPKSMNLLLVPGADWVCNLRSQGDPWPATAVITIEIADTVWTATISDTTATFNIDQTEVDAIIALGPTRFSLWYTDGPSRLPWATGPVRVHRG
jgi:hypothetical protein